jgi:hypothetical protein
MKKLFSTSSRCLKAQKSIKKNEAVLKYTRAEIEENNTFEKAPACCQAALFYGTAYYLVWSV